MVSVVGRVTMGDGGIAPTGMTVVTRTPIMASLRRVYAPFPEPATEHLAPSPRELAAKQTEGVADPTTKSAFMRAMRASPLQNDGGDADANYGVPTVWNRRDLSCGHHVCCPWSAG